MSKARHRRPSKAARVAAITTPAAVAAGMLLTGSSAAHAQTVTPHHPQAPAAPVAAPVINKAQLAAERAKAFRPAVPKTVTIAPGQYLSMIAANDCGSASDWPAIYERNKSTIGGNPNFVTPGEQLVLDCHHMSAGIVTATAKVSHASSGGRTWDVSYGYPNHCGDGDGDGWDVNCATRDGGNTDPAPVAEAVHHHSSGSFGNVNPGNYSGFQACVIARESGGNSQVMNSSGHYGLYQFSASTWAAYGGNPGDFGHASASEQTRVFDNAMATPGGASNWSPYDGC